MSRKIGAALAVAGLVATVVGGIAYYQWRLPRFQGQINALEVKLAQPHGYVATPALSRLPRDLIKAPLARELLSEDFAFYYEDHEDRASVQGAIKRLAFEHQLTLSDQLLAAALDEPAELAFWADAKGAPRYWVMSMTRGVLTRALEQLAPVAAKDQQLSVIGEMSAPGGSVKVYALRLSPRRTLGLVAQGERLVVLSDPGLLFDNELVADPASAKVVASLLADKAGTSSVFRKALGLEEASADHHTVVAEARLLTLGYQHFFPGVQALRLNVGSAGRSLNAQLRLAPGALPGAGSDRSVWQGMPLNAASCALLPTDWQRVKAIVGRSDTSADAAVQAAWVQVSDQLEGPAAVCWYARSQLHTPLLVAHTKAGAPDLSTALATLSEWLMPTPSAVPTDVPAQMWQREVSAPWGPRGKGDETQYRPTLAREGAWLSYSPDDKLVALALDAQARRYPSLAEGLPATEATLAVLSPKDMADMGEREVFQVLPASLAPWRQAVETQLVPRLNALRNWPAVRAVATGAPDARGWVSIDWRPLSTAAQATP